MYVEEKKAVCAARMDYAAAFLPVPSTGCCCFVVCGCFIVYLRGCRLRAIFPSPFAVWRLPSPVPRSASGVSRYPFGVCRYLPFRVCRLLLPVAVYCLAFAVSRSAFSVCRLPFLVWRFFPLPVWRLPLSSRRRLLATTPFTQRVRVYYLWFASASASALL